MVLLDISNQGLRYLPHIPEYITELDCSNNQIENIYGKNLLASLKKLNCSHNNLSVLSCLPSTLSWLDCSHNLLTNIDHIPFTLKYLYCDYNRFTRIRNLPHNMTELNCAYNPLLIFNMC